MRHRNVMLPLFGLLTEQVHHGLVVNALLSIPGVSHARFCPETEVLDLEYDPARCGPAQLLAAIESFGNRGERLQGSSPW
jgi:hypothetical protein